MKFCFPDTEKRVELNTCKSINEKIRKQTLENIEDYTNEDDNEIKCRISKLNKEWDIERLIEVNAATIVILSSILGAKANKKWFAVTGVVGMFLLQHAVQGWCPSLSLFRRLGIRTCSEIGFEKATLKKFLKIHKSY